METKLNVKQRRLERLKRLQVEDTHKASPMRNGRDNSRFVETRRPDHGVPKATPHPVELEPASDSRWSDPEYAWKHRHNHGRMAYADYEPPRPDESRFSLAPPERKRLWVRLILCGIIFAGMWGMFRLPYPWAQAGKQFVTTALTEPMNTEALAVWYEKKFRGMPSILPSFHRGGEESVKVSLSGSRTFFAPAKGIIATPFTAGKQGIVIKTLEDAPVYAMDTGLVTYAGPREGTGFTVELQHPNGLKTVYGDVEECKLEVNDWIKGGEAIGKATRQTDGGRLYFAVQKEGRYVNPAEVVSIVQ